MKIKLLVGGLIFLIIINLATIGTFLIMQLSKDEQKFKYRAQDSLMIPPFLHPDSRGERLNDEQRQKLFGMFKKFRTETREVNEEIKVLQHEIQELLMSEEINEEELNAKMQKIAELRLSISRAAIKNIIEAKTFLTPEQVEHFVRAIMHFRPPHRDGMPPEFNRRHRESFKRRDKMERFQKEGKN
ncbi:MAG: periplasmic heavy metal sensor [Ignavibacterium sp.]|nr:MAG: periplasmic heavy metal sensor [Ignavibacterium sp.]